MYRKTRIDKELHLIKPLGTQGLAVEDWWKDTYNDINYYNATGMKGIHTDCAIAMAGATLVTGGATAPIALAYENCDVCCSTKYMFNKSKRLECKDECWKVRREAKKTEEQKIAEAGGTKTAEQKYGKCPSGMYHIGDGSACKGGGKVCALAGNPDLERCVKPVAREGAVNGARKGLSTMAWIGIGVGVVAIGVTAYFLLRKK